MRSLSIQVQPDRIPDLDIEKTKQLFEALKDSSLVEKSAFDEGNDEGRYLNFTYGTNDAQSLWRIIQKKIYAHNVFGKQLLNAQWPCVLVKKAGTITYFYTTSILRYR